MVFDNIKNAHLYKGLGEGFKNAFDYVEKLGLESFLPGDIREIGGGVSLNVSKIECKAPDNDFYEAHRKFADIQLVLSGVEHMGFQYMKKLSPRVPYDEKKDIAWYSGKGTLIKFEKGDFAIFFPQDAHMPCRNDGGTPCESIKLVVKVPV